MPESTVQPIHPGSVGESVATDPRMAPVELPEVHTLSEGQVRGGACVWCAIILSSATAVDLGEWQTNAPPSRIRWFPRSCHGCAQQQCYQALLVHSPTCEQCADESALCATSRALRRILRETRR